MPAAPLQFKLDLLIRDGDVFWHQLEMRVPTVAHTTMLATIHSVGYRCPSVDHVDRAGSLKIKPAVRARLLTEMFTVLKGMMLKNDGDRITFQFSDLAPWIHDKFDEADAHALISRIVDAVPVGRVFQDVCMIDIG